MQIDKLSGSFYEINLNEIRLSLVERYENHHPDIHITKTIHTEKEEFWNFVFDAVIELKQRYFEDLDEGYHIDKTKAKIEMLRGVEKSLIGMVSKSRIERERGMKIINE